MITTCYRCHEPGHLRSQCPRKREVPAAAPLRAAAVSGYPAVPPRRPTAEVAADPAGHAAVIRTALGWHPADSADRLRELARRQVAESRELMCR